MPEFGDLPPAELAKSKTLQMEMHNLLHAIQSGVAAKIALQDPAETAPKHLRVGVNSALVNHAALAAILVRKGIITELEYFQSCVDELRKEVQSYETELSAVTGKVVTLM